MRILLSLALALLLSSRLAGQEAIRTVSVRELQSVISLPLSQAVAAREAYKKPLKAAFARQAGDAASACQEVFDQQQPYNICIGKADTSADNDFAIFYNNLQMLCHDDDQLVTLQQAEQQWKAYSASAMKAAHSAWPNGSGAPGYVGEVYLSLVRNFMRELSVIYGLNITQ